MAEQRSTIEFAPNIDVVTKLKYDQPYKSGVNKFGAAWHLWTVEDKNGTDVSLFATDRLNSLLLAANPVNGLWVTILKEQEAGEKSTRWKLWKGIDGNWVPVEADMVEQTEPAPPEQRPPEQKPPEQVEQRPAPPEDIPSNVTQSAILAMGSNFLQCSASHWAVLKEAGRIQDYTSDNVQSWAQTMLNIAKDARTVIPPDRSEELEF